jgi:hypothetical protein
VAQWIGTGSTLRQAMAHGAVSVVPGQHIQASARVAGVGTGINVTFNMRYRFLAADRVTLSLGYEQAFSITGTAWVKTAFPAVLVPAGAAYVETYVQRLAGGSANTIMFTNVSVIIADDIAFARAEEAIVASTSATASVASITGTIVAQFGSVSSFVSQTATAVAMANFAASTLVFRVQAGGGDGSIRLVAFDDVDGSGSAIMLDADNIIAPGTMSVGRLVVMDHGTNLVPDDQIQSASDWTGVSTMSVIPTSTNPNPDSKGEIRYTFDGGAGLPDGMFSQYFPVRSNSRLVCSFQSQRLGGTHLVAQARLDWYDHDRAPITSVLITPDGAFFEMLKAETAWIQTANIGTAIIGNLQLMNGSVSTQAWSAQATRAGGSGRDTWQNIASVGISRRAGSALYMSGSFGYVDGGNPGGRLQMRFRRDGGPVLNTFGLERPLRAEGSATHSWFDVANLSGVHTYQIDVYVPNSWASTLSWEDITLFLQELSR